MLSPIFAEITDTCMRKNCQLNIINSVFGVLCFYLFFVEWQWKRSLSNIKTVLNCISKQLEVCQKQFFLHILSVVTRNAVTHTILCLMYDLSK